MALPKLSQPTFEFTVPSTKKKIKMRPMLVKEEKILLMAKQSGSRNDIMSAIKQIVNNCITTEGLGVEKLAIFDLEYLFLKLRSISISNITNVSYKDNEDEQKYDFEIDLDKIEIDMSKAPSNKISLSKDVILELSWPSVDIYTDKELYEISDADMFTFMLDRCMTKVFQGDTAFDPKTSTPEERKEFIENIPAKAAEQIRKFFGSVPSLSHELKYKNSKGTDRTIVLGSLEDFFTL